MKGARTAALSVALETERLHIEPIGAHHGPLLFDAMQDPAIYEWISSTPPASAEALTATWSRAAERLSVEHDIVYLNWAVSRKADGAWVGKLDAELDGDVATNLGYLFFPPFWRCGYATEAVRALSAHLAGLGICEQRAFVTDGNTRSMRVLERANFVRTRVLPANDVVRGVAVDDVEYILRT